MDRNRMTLIAAALTGVVVLALGFLVGVQPQLTAAARRRPNSRASRRRTSPCRRASRRSRPTTPTSRTEVRVGDARHVRPSRAAPPASFLTVARPSWPAPRARPSRGSPRPTRWPMPLRPDAPAADRRDRRGGIRRGRPTERGPDGRRAHRPRPRDRPARHGDELLVDPDHGQHPGQLRPGPRLPSMLQGGLAALPRDDVRQHRELRGRRRPARPRRSLDRRRPRLVLQDAAATQADQAAEATPRPRPRTPTAQLETPPPAVSHPSGGDRVADPTDLRRLVCCGVRGVLSRPHTTRRRERDTTRRSAGRAAAARAARPTAPPGGRVASTDVPCRLRRDGHRPLRRARHHGGGLRALLLDRDPIDEPDAGTLLGPPMVAAAALVVLLSLLRSAALSDARDGGAGGAGHVPRPARVAAPGAPGVAALRHR